MLVVTWNGNYELSKMRTLTLEILKGEQIISGTWYKSKSKFMNLYESLYFQWQHQHPPTAALPTTQTTSHTKYLHSNDTKTRFILPFPSRREETPFLFTVPSRRDHCIYRPVRSWNKIPLYFTRPSPSGKSIPLPSRRIEKLCTHCPVPPTRFFRYFAVPSSFFLPWNKLKC